MERGRCPRESENVERSGDPGREKPSPWGADRGGMRTGVPVLVPGFKGEGAGRPVSGSHFPVPPFQGKDKALNFLKCSQLNHLSEFLQQPILQIQKLSLRDIK